MTKKQLYTLTDEHRAQLGPWAEKWIANALSTAPMTDEDRAAMRTAILGLYAAPNLEPPKTITFVASPFILRFASGFAAILLDKGRDITPLDTVETQAEQDVYVATAAALGHDITPPRVTGTAALSDGDWYVYDTRAMRRLAENLGEPEALLQGAVDAYRMWNGGNQWSGWVAHLSFFRHIAKLDIDWSKWAHYEAAAVHGGPRAMHRQFCIVSDRPAVLTVDERRQPHAERGPFCVWRDGSKLYSYHGVRIPARVIENRDRLTVADIDGEANAEVRRVMLELYGFERYILDTGATPIRTDETGALYEVKHPDGDNQRFVLVVDGTPDEKGERRKYVLHVRPDVTTAIEAVASTYRHANEKGEMVEMSVEQYRRLMLRT